MFIALQEAGQPLITSDKVKIQFDSPKSAEEWLTKNGFKKYESCANTDLWESNKSGYVVDSLYMNRSEGEVIRANVKIDTNFVDPEDVQFT